MAEAFQLICHHTYKGLPLDLSDYDSHGQAFGAEFLRDGASPGSGCVRFNSPASVIALPSSPASKALGGIKVEVTLRRPGPLTSADGSATLGVHSLYFFPGTIRITPYQPSLPPTLSPRVTTRLALSSVRGTLPRQVSMCGRGKVEDPEHQFDDGKSGYRGRFPEFWKMFFVGMAKRP